MIDGRCKKLIHSLTGQKLYGNVKWRITMPYPTDPPDDSLSFLEDEINREENMVTINSFSCNINDLVHVQLTDYGIEHVKNSEYHSYLLEYNFDKKKKILSIPLWELMYVFGKEMYMGNTKNCFNNEITIESN